MPNFNAATSRIAAFYNLYHGMPGLDLDAELEILREDLQAIFHNRLKWVAPDGEVTNGDLLTYTVYLSVTPGVDYGFYDPLTDSTFVSFVEQPAGIVHEDDAITGTFTATSTEFVVTFVAQADAPDTAASVTNRACLYVLTDTLSACQWTNRAVNPLPTPDVGIWKGIPGGGFARPGGKFVYVIVYWNGGNRAASDVAVVDTLPLSTTYFGDTSGVAPEVGAGGVVTWHLGSLNTGGGDDSWGMFAVTVDVSDDMLTGTGVLTHNCASITTATPGDAPGNDVSCVGPVDVWEEDYGINVDKWPGLNDPTPGQEFDYWMRWCTDGGASFGPVWLTDTLPLSTTLLSWEENDWPQALWTEAITTGGQLVLYAPGLPGNYCQQLRLRLLLDPAAPLGMVVQNTVVVTTSGDAWPDNNARTNSDARVGPPRYDMVVGKNMNSGVLVPDGWVDYHISYRNQGNSAVHAWLTDTLPEGTSYWDGSAREQDGGPAFPPVTVTEEYVVWDLGEIGVNEGFGLDFTIYVSDTVDPDTVITNCATVGITHTEDTPWDNTACVTETIHDSGPNLRVTKQSWWNGDGQLGYRIQYYNVGDEEIDTAWLTDTYPLSTSVPGDSIGWDSWEGFNVNCADNAGDGQLVCEIQNLEPGWSAGIWFNSDLDDPNARPAWFTNTVEIGPPDDYPDDNSATVVDVKREVEQVDLDIYRTRMWGYAPQGPITITDALTQTVLPDGGWFDFQFGDGFDPGEVITVAAGNGLLPVVIDIPDPLSAYASSITDTVWGQIEGAGGQQVNIDLWGYAGRSVQADGDGNYSFTFPDVPRGAMGDVNYYTTVDYAQVGFHRRFQAPDLILRVNYGHDWIEGNYPEAGRTILITVTDSLSEVKGTTVLTTGVVPWWNGEIGFSTNWHGWTSDQPDIAPGDWVYAAMDNGYTSTVHVGAITGTVSVDDDTITGNVVADWFTQTLDVECQPWNVPGGAPNKYSSAAPDGSVPYFCAWDPLSEWDIQPNSEQIGVLYLEPDGDSVYNVFVPPHIYIRTFYDYYDHIEGNTTPGATVWITVTDSLGSLKDTDSDVARGDGEYYFDNLADIVPTDWVTATSSDGTSTSMQVIQIEGVLDTGADTISGTMSGPGATFPAQGVVRLRTVYGEWYNWNLSIDGAGDYFLDMGGERDVIPGDEVQVFYGAWGQNQTERSFREPVPHVMVQKQGSGRPGEGGNFAFRISYQNSGDADAADTAITDTLLYGMTYLTDTSGLSHTGSGAPGDPLVWQLGTLGAGAYAWFDVYVEITATAGEWVTNTVQIATSDPYDEYRPWEYNNGWGKESGWSDEVQPGGVSLEVGKDSWTGDPTPGGEFVYYVRVCNHDATGSTQVTLTDTLHISTTLLTWWAREPGWSEVSSDAHSLVLSRLTIPGWECHEVYLSVALTDTAVINDWISNTVVITASNDIDGGNESTRWVRVNSPHTNLSVNKWWNWGQLTPGGEIRYQIEYRNNGNVPVTSTITLTDTFPVSTTLLNIWRYDHNWNYIGLVTPTLGAGYAAWEVGAIDNGYWGYFEVALQVDEDAIPGAVLTNTVEISPQPGEDSTDDNTSTVVETLFDYGPNLRVRKWGDWHGDRAGHAWYGFRIENVGSENVSQVILTDTYPLSMTMEGGVNTDWGRVSGFNHDPDGHWFTFTLENVHPSYRLDFSFNTTMTEPVPFGLILTNTVAVQPVSGDDYPDDDAADYVLTTGPDLYVEKTLVGGELLPGGVVTFSLRFGNDQPGHTWWWNMQGNAWLTDTLPAGMTIITATQHWCGWTDWCTRLPDFTNGNQLVWQLWLLGSSQWNEIYLTVQITDTAAGGEPFTNQVEIASDQPISDTEPYDDNNTSQITITVTNQPPEADAGSNQNMPVGAVVTLDGSGSSDADHNLPLGYGWQQTGGPAVSFDPALSVTTFSAPGAPTVLTFTLSVTDSLGLADATPDEVVVTIEKADTTVTITSDERDPSVVGESVVVSFTVAVVPPGSGTPTGIVTVVDGEGNDCFASVATGACDLILTSVGTKTITATYAGNSSFNGSVITTTHVVGKASTALTITSDLPDPSVVGESVVVSFTVAVDPPGSGTPTGNVGISTGGGPTCSAPISEGACSLVFTSTGEVTITAEYAGSANFSGSSITTTHVVNLRCTSLVSVTFTYLPARVLINTPLTFTATHAPLGADLPITYTWDFDDGVTATLTAPSVQHTYVTSGTFTVRLTAYNPCTPAGVSHQADIIVNAWRVYLPLVLRNY
ncbi:MAG: PKD domain-containing protein [Anaerolineae bacterium]|nr:PKD domain-containing protein [Anaerolineae bacterium]